MVQDKRSKEDEIQHPRMPQGETKATGTTQQLKSIFSAPSWALLHGCRIEVLELRNALLFVLNLHPQLILLGISSNLISVNVAVLPEKSRTSVICSTHKVEEIFDYLLCAGIR